MGRYSSRSLACFCVAAVGPISAVWCIRVAGNMAADEIAFGTSIQHLGLFFRSVRAATTSFWLDRAKHVWPVFSDLDTPLLLLCVVESLGVLTTSVVLGIYLRPVQNIIRRRVRLGLRRTGFAPLHALEALPHPAWVAALEVLWAVGSAMLVFYAAPPFMNAWWGALACMVILVMGHHILLPAISGLFPPNAADRPGEARVCLVCGYSLGPRVNPPCPECGQSNEQRSRDRAYPSWLPRLALAGGAVSALVLGVLYTFDDFSDWRPHRLLQSDWERQFGRAYHRQLGVGTFGHFGETPLRLATACPTWFLFTDGSGLREGVTFSALIDCEGASSGSNGLLRSNGTASIVGWSPRRGAPLDEWGWDVRVQPATPSGAIVEQQVFKNGAVEFLFVDFSIPTDQAGIRGAALLDIASTPSTDPRPVEAGREAVRRLRKAVGDAFNTAASLRSRNVTRDRL